jgi:hypothetical protein
MREMRETLAPPTHHPPHPSRTTAAVPYSGHVLAISSTLTAVAHVCACGGDALCADGMAVDA